MKQALLRVMRASGLFATFRRANQRKILVVTYHRFSEQPKGGFTHASAFAEQLEYLRAHYTIVPLSAIGRHLIEGEPLPNAPAAITIDDGYRDAYEVAFPILRRHRAPATLFAATDFIDRKGWLWTDKLRYVEARKRSSSALDARRANEELKRLPNAEKDKHIAAIAHEAGVTMPALPPADCGAITWDQAREMATAGIDIGSHTVTHPILTHVDLVQLGYELQQSRSRLEDELDREVALFCYPNGDYNARVRGAVERAGYRVAVTTEGGLNDGASDPLALRRIHTEGDITRFVQSTSGFEHFKSGFRTASAPLRSRLKATADDRRRELPG
jgi:peptidoglycan/xylan/chitin deacetylase (PgdA/CDA1 family)